MECRADLANTAKRASNIFIQSEKEEIENRNHLFKKISL